MKIDNKDLDFARKVLRTLENIRDLLTHQAPPRQEPRKTDSEQQYANQEQNPANIHAVAASKPAPPINPTTEPKDHWYKRFPWWKCWEGVGIFAVVAYAIITYRMWDDANSNFKIDQRAWVGFEESTDIVFQAGKQASITHIFMNTGKTPALDVKMHANSIRVPGQTSFEDSMATYKTPLSEYGPSRSLILPGAKASLHIVSRDAVPQEQVDAISTGQSTLYIFGETCYSDVFGGKHYTSFCEFLTPDLIRVGNCGTYNRADDKKHPYCGE